MKNILRTFQREAFNVIDFKIMFPSVRTGFFIAKRGYPLKPGQNQALAAYS
jgi:hypothetical protein